MPCGRQQDNSKAFTHLSQPQDTITRVCVCVCVCVWLQEEHMRVINQNHINK